MLQIAPAQPLPANYSPSVADVVDRFIKSLDIKPVSRSLYRRTVELFFTWVAGRGYSVAELSRDHVLEYKEEMMGSGLSPLTVSSYINSLRQFYEWCEACKYYPNIAKGIKSPKKKNKFKRMPLAPAQATALLEFYRGKALRDFAIVSLLLRTGLRTVELIRANVEDITYMGGKRVLKVWGKGRDSKDDFVILTDKAYQPIADYLATRPGHAGNEPLFFSCSNNSKGERLTTRTISGIAKEGLKAIGLNERAFSAHSLRHTAGTSLLRHTGDLEQTRLMMRHSNPATTLLYVDTLKEERRLQNSGETALDEIY
jgi:integrase/recombinase XerD